jgi:hypothetical protein
MNLQLEKTNMNTTAKLEVTFAPTSELSSWVQPIVPEGRATIARRFNAGLADAGGPSPEGTAESFPQMPLVEFAPAGVTATPLILLGRLKPLHIRVDVDEHEAWRVHPEAKATAAVRGNANLKAPLAFVRFEPFVVLKKSLTGDSTERVDTRVLQVIYRLEGDALPLFVGQQMDIFIEGSNPTTAKTMK